MLQIYFVDPDPDFHNDGLEEMNLYNRLDPAVYDREFEEYVTHYVEKADEDRERHWDYHVGMGVGGRSSPPPKPSSPGQPSSSGKYSSPPYKPRD